MVMLTARTRALNSLVFIHDAAAKGSPAIDGVGVCWVAPAVIAVSCLPDCDGATEIRLGKIREMQPSEVVVFDGELQTPSGHLVVSDVRSNRILEIPVASPATRLTIWTNGRQDSDVIAIGLA